MRTKLHFVLSITMFLFTFSAIAQQDYWVVKDVVSTDITDKVSNLDEKHFLTYELSLNALKQQLQNAPLRGINTTVSNSVIYLPNEYGKTESFRILESPVLSEEQSARYPNIKTYQGFSINNPGTRARFSVSPQGLQAMITYRDKPATFVVPVNKTNSGTYIAYNRGTRLTSVKDFECLTEVEVLPINTQSLNRDANDQLLRTFRIAISTTGEYTNYWDDGDAGNGDAQQDALAQVVSTLNRMNEVFEVDMAVTFNLVNGTEIIYPDAATDPYTGSLNGQVQNTLTAEVGEANYDIGHLFTFAPNNGNAGCIGCVCVDGQKGSAFSAHQFTDNDGGPYMSDYFDIDYVPHEVGHQMGANHTFSFNSEGTGVNAEPGSGTTIMGYAGITGSNDVQDHSDPYFHYYSISQILNNLIGQNCWVGLPISNSPPVADAGSDYSIPIGTAFVLKGNATDADGGDVLTYTWEQIDDGVTTSGNFGPNKASGPVWRSRPPSDSPDRYMPIIERVIAGQLTQTNPLETPDNSSWETVSNVGRNLNFALTVRDRSDANGIGQEPQSGFDTMLVTVDASAGPFVVTSQGSNITWDAGSNQIVTWDVADTDSGAVNAANVNILLSTDGGFTFPFVMASNVPNDGAQDITVPITGGDTSLARVKVEASDNIFYAINSTNFTIQESEFVLNVAEPSIDVCTPNDAIYNFTYNTFLGFTGTTTFSASGLPVGASAVFSPATASADGTVVSVTVSGTGTLAVGNYAFSLVGTSGSIEKSADVELNIYDTNLADLNILTPADGSTDVEADLVEFTWDEDINATAYEIDIATDAAFTSVVSGAVVNENSYVDNSLNITTLYFWRVRSVNDCASGNYSTASFTTANIACGTFNSTDTPIAIPDASAFGANSVINVTDVSVITDVNITVNITHSFDGDLILSLVSPSGTTIILSNQNGGSGDNYGGTTFDSDAPNSITTGSAPFAGVYSPEGDLSVFDGTNSAGDWTLNVSDNAFFDTGTIDSWSIEICGIPQSDTDGDLIPDNEDNCPSTANNDQSDIDNDGLGDVCDDDIDNDGILNGDDNCPETANPDQIDSNNNGIGDPCDIECGIFGSVDTPVVIPDNSPIGANSSITVTDAFTITDVNVTVNITHTYDADLTISLTSPNGSEIILSDGNGGSGDNYTNTVFDDDGNTLIQAGSAPFTGTFVPEESLSTFNDEVSGGIWTLKIVDGFGLDIGTLNSWSIEVCGLPQDDIDGDGIPNDIDNCPETANADQADNDNDGLGDVCDDDNDNDGILNANDNCPETANPDQSDFNNNGIGDACDEECQLETATDLPITIADVGDDATYTTSVIIPENLIVTDVNVTINIDHTWDSDLVISLTSPEGDTVELSSGNGGSGDNYTDTVFDQDATLPINAGSPPFTGTFIPEGDLTIFNGSFSAGEWILTVTDTFGAEDGGSINLFILEVCGLRDPSDLDGDAILNEADNCPLTANADQADQDGDGIGDVCDPDIDGDGIVNESDNCPTESNASQDDNDLDGIGDLCDDDDDNDGVLDDEDNCPLDANPEQSDVNGNGIGDICDGLIVNDILTPNGDNINDTWIILNAERYPNAVIRVFSRSGNEVFSSRGYNNDWSGTSNSGGDTLPTGSYLYQIDQNGDGSVILTGWIYITL